VMAATPTPALTTEFQFSIDFLRSLDPRSQKWQSRHRRTSLSLRDSICSRRDVVY
jgi:hypothetical protein